MASKFQNVDFVQKAFSEEEWKYLSEHKAYQAVLKKKQALDDYELLVDAGVLLLMQRNDLEILFAKRNEAR